MQLDKFIGVEADILKLGGYDFKTLAAKWERPFDMKSYDRVEVTENEMSEMLKLAWQKKEFGSELIEYPSLREFTVYIREPGTNLGTMMCFRKSLLTREIVDRRGNSSITYKPFVDAYIHFVGSPQNLDMVVTLAKATMKNENDKRTVNMTSSHQMWIGVRSPILKEAAIADYPLITEYCRDVKLVYMTMQYFFRHRPVLFKELTERRTVQKKQSNGKKTKYINKVRAIKVITVIPDELATVRVAVSHEITCPCWGVMGHWRTYKTGKKVWIQPYVKGKERNNPAAYQPKEYEFSKEVHHD